MQIADRIIGKVERDREQIVNFLRRMVRIPSVTGSEGAMAQFVAEALAGMGLHVDSWELNAEELSARYPDYFVGYGHPYKGRPNVVGILRGNGRGRSLLLNGHVDVVSPEPVGSWRHDPWAGDVEDGKLFGRGACDMKGGVAAMIMAVRILREEGIELEGDVFIESVIEEEGPGNGTLACQARGYRADAGIVAEPTNLEIHAAITGGIYAMIVIEGKAAHSTMPFEGVNAIEKSMTVIKAIQEFRDWRIENSSNPLYLRCAQVAGASPVLTLERIDSKNFAEVPSKIMLGTRATVMPGETPQAVSQQMEEWIRRAAAEDPWLRENSPQVNWIPLGARNYPAEVSVDHPLVYTLREAVHRVRTEEPIVAGFPSTADWQHLNNIEPRTPTVGFGPGKLEQAHTVDEFVSLDDVIDCTKALALTIVQWCGVAR